MQKQTLLFAMLMMSASTAFAESAQVNFSGTVAAIPCVVDGSDSVSVKLGDIRASDLDSSIISTSVPFKIKLKNCPAIATAIATFSGMYDMNVAGYKNTGTASNVAVQIADTDTSKFVTPGFASITKSVSADRTITYNMLARAITNGSPTPGTIITVLQVDFTYP
ncbi:fimbrial protein [Serratia fonticola]|jgi:type 1 fimbria pilin|uniref:fimbrial protein n=1 Tax=Serratia fonticola TaxID=47917 RepID=UPI00217969AF|nr:fimbrial protein [Serratia fonticola]CAI1708625.1 S-fimbrial adhesin protein SfaS precursor [Serratia fonticola]CAI1725570.1 S-fimbrial adhesin protein SfaS precursor [Serratia fonticola]